MITTKNEILLFNSITFTNILRFGPPEHRYNSSFKDEYKAELKQWCEENCEGLYAIGRNYLEFQLDNDYVLAKLTYFE